MRRAKLNKKLARVHSAVCASVGGCCRLVVWEMVSDETQNRVEKGQPRASEEEKSYSLAEESMVIDERGLRMEQYGTSRQRRKKTTGLAEPGAPRGSGCEADEQRV